MTKCYTPGTHYAITIGWDARRGLVINVIVTPPDERRLGLWQSYNDQHENDRLADAVHDALEPLLAREMGFDAQPQSGKS